MYYSCYIDIEIIEENTYKTNTDNVAKNVKISCLSHLYLFLHKEL